MILKARLSLLCAAVLLIGSVPDRSLAQEISVYIDSTEQLIRGFGGAFIEYWQPDLPAEDVETAFGLGDDQIGLSILRLGINPNPDQWSENLEAAQKAGELGALIFASPWNAPDHLLKEKTNPGDADTVDVNKYAEYAQHLDDFNTYMSDNGVELYAISIQNEPDFADEWTGWTSENMVTFLRDHAPAIGTRIMAPESFQFRKDFSDPILLDSLAAAHTDIIGGHIYGGGNSSYPLAEKMGKEVWMTEYLLNLNTGNISTPWYEFSDEERWDETMDMLRTVHVSMKSNMNAYVWWYLRRYYSFVGDGEFMEEAGEVTKRGYAFSHFSKFVRPDDLRLQTDGPFERGYIRIYATAYLDTTSSRMTLVAINDEDVDRDVNFVFDRPVSATFNRYITSVDLDREHLEDVSVSGSTLTVTLPTNTVTTFVSDQVSVANESVGEIPAGFRLEANHPNPFSRTTVIGYGVPKSGTVRLDVFDVHGREVATLVDGPVRAGRHQVRFDATGLSSGVYFYRLGSEDVTIGKTMPLAY